MRASIVSGGICYKGNEGVEIGFDVGSSREYVLGTGQFLSGRSRRRQRFNVASRPSGAGDGEQMAVYHGWMIKTPIR